MFRLSIFRKIFLKIFKFLLVLLFLTIFILLSASALSNLYYPKGNITSSSKMENGANKYPFMVSIQRLDMHWCSGVILNEDYILTAGHCVANFDTNKKHPKSYFTVIAGIDGLLLAAGKRYDIDEIILHPNYYHYAYDIALLKLHDQIALSANYNVIKLEHNKLLPNTEITVIGWKSNQMPKTRIPSGLKENKLVLLSEMQCNQYLAESYLKGMICLRHPDEFFPIGSTYDRINECVGDAGGPAIFNNKLIGISNFVGAECSSEYVNGFASISFYKNWIENEINKRKYMKNKIS